MKKLLTTSLLAIIYLSLNAQTLDWAWAKSAGGTDADYGRDISTDLYGNVYITGDFLNQITFGNITLVDSNSRGLFIVKYDAQGNILWARSASNCYGHSVATDVSGNVYLSGVFSNKTTFGGGDTFVSAGGQDIFMVKYNSQGDVMWVRTAGGRGGDVSRDIQTDVSGNVYMTGSFSSPSTIIFGKDTFLSNASYKYFLVKYNSVGDVIWAKTADQKRACGGSTISLDSDENVYVSGLFDTDPITFGTKTLTCKGENDIFLVKYDPFGRVIWAKSAGGNDWEFARKITTDASNNVYLIGGFQSTSITFGSSIVTNKGYYDMLILKFDSSGNELWARSGGGSYYEVDGDIALDKNGDLYIIGSYSSPSFNYDTVLLFTNGQSDIYLIKCDASGNVISGNSIGGFDDDYGRAITTDPAGNVYLICDFNSNLIAFGDTTLINAGKTDFVISKIGHFVGIEENNYSEHTLKIFPNPSSYMTTLTTDNNLKDATLTVLNIYGQVVKQIVNISGQTVTLYRDNLPSGLYLIRLLEGNHVVAISYIVFTD